MTTTQTSQNVTNEQLAAWGFPVLVTDKLVGCTFTVSEGTSRGRAVHAAWVAGLVEVRTSLRAGAEAQVEAGLAYAERLAKVLAGEAVAA